MRLHTLSLLIGCALGLALALMLTPSPHQWESFLAELWQR